MPEYLQFVVGLILGLLSCLALLMGFGKWLLRAVIKEVIAEMSKDWVSKSTGDEMDKRITRLEKQFDAVLIGTPKGI